MDAETAALFPDSFGDSELGLIPAGWSISTVKDCFGLNYGKALKAEKRIKGDYPVFGSNGVVGSHSEALVQSGHLVIGRKGTVGSVNLSQGPSWPIDTAFFVIPDAKFGLFYTYFLFSHLGLEEMDTDAAVPGLNRDNVYGQLIVQPSQVTLDAYHKVACPFFEQIEILTKQIQVLTEIRDSLLPRLISGELEIPEGLLGE
jgi:type I restriction enzyme S subunit